MSPASNRLWRILASTALLAGGAAAVALAHDMFLKPSSFFLAPNSALPTVLLNGTFDKSMNSISRPRLADVSLVGPAGRTRIDTTAWDAKGDTSKVTFKVGAAGTYVLGVSTKPSAIELDAKDFNDYLKEDGLPDELARRERSGEINAEAKEQYQKHVKSIIQVGETRSNGFATVLGYPAEIVPLTNPYQLAPGQSLRVRVLVDGKPVANQHVVYGARTPSGATVAEQGVRAGADGVATLAITSPGVWYVKFISMKRMAAGAEFTHQSKWATLTFATR